jgi:ectoine hydroxylase-related dioxygenase (phytanoyl-CoA dioxygenase family)
MYFYLMTHGPTTISALKDMWEKTLQNKTVTNKEWSEQVQAIHACGKGLEETLRYLYLDRPTLNDFITWMTPQVQLKDAEVFIEDVLHEDDINFFKKNGYVVIRNAVSQEQCAHARNAILEFLHADINDPSSWYKEHAERRGLMLMFYHHPALETNRNSARIRKAFEQLYGSSAIHKVIDKVSFHPPETSSCKFNGSPLHWDASLATPIPFKLQGLLYLNDVAADGGAFHCVPGFHTELEEWLQSLDENVNPRDEAIRVLKPQAITGDAGDFIVWHQALPHCATPNRSNVPRFVQYFTYDPDNYVGQEVWK